MKKPALTDAQIDEVFNQMPDGAQGFLKNWGYRQFAHALFEAAAQQTRAAVQTEHTDHRLTLMVDAAMVEMQGIYPPLRRSECQRLIHAALTAAPEISASPPVVDPEALMELAKTKAGTP